MPRGRSRAVGNDQLSTLFRRIRDDAGIDGAEAARQAGVSQATISRWESGLRIPTAESAEEYATTLGAEPELTRQLVQLITDLRDQHRAGPRGAAFQTRVTRIEEAAASVAVFQPILIPGALQTEAYARAVFGSNGAPEDEVTARTMARLARGALLIDPARTYTFVITDGALAWRSGSTETMARQVEHLAELSRRPNIRLGVIPWGTEVNVYPPCGFDLYDQRTAVVGLPNGAHFFTNPDDVAYYVRMLEKLTDLASFDDDARKVLAQIARDYRETT